MARRNIWEPLGTLMTMQQAMDRLYDETYGRRQDWRRGERVELLPVDAYSTPEKVVILASVPGLNPEDVDITIEGETLTIRGTTQPVAENVDYVIQERRFGPFSRTLTLNVPVQAEKAEAVFENGVLTLTIPKAEEVKPRQIKVKSGSGD
jgi:HSP20 family protein